MPETREQAAWRRKVSRSVRFLLVSVFIAFGLASWAIVQIQTERKNNVRVNCEQQNARHDRTVVALDRVLDAARRTADARRLAQIEQSRVSTILLIDALAPVQDCEQRVDDLVGTGPVDFLPF